MRAFSVPYGARFSIFLKTLPDGKVLSIKPVGKRANDCFALDELLRR